MAKPLLVANWKNYPGSLAETSALLNTLARDKSVYKKLAFFIAPPLPYLAKVSERARNFAHLACQDFPTVLRGTQTGVVTPEILKSFGIKLAILGHSEMRSLGETSEEVAAKIKLALKSGIQPLVCVGEYSRDQDGEHFEFLREQIKASLSGLQAKEISQVILAYEPVWAIGKSGDEALTPEDLKQSMIFIRKILTDLFGRKLAEKIPILYGGSVEPVNVENLFNTREISGFLVGHASLNARMLRSIALSLK